MRGWFVVAVFGLSCAVRAQQAAPASAPPQLSPQAAYEQATRPLDITRNATANWSDAEKNALGVAMLQATRECKARRAEQYTGDDLLAYLQLCTLGWQWNAVQDGAWLYINAQHKAPPGDKTYTIAGLTAAYGYEIKSSLSLNDDRQAFLCSQAMLREVPYTPMVSNATSATIRYLQIIHTEQARALAAQRYLLLLDLLRRRGAQNAAASPAVAGAAADAGAATVAAAAAPGMAVHLLYTDAIQWPMMMQFNKSFEPDTVVAELDAALPAKLSDDDAILTGEARRRYRLFGAQLPPIKASLYLANPKFVLPADFGKGAGAGTVFLLFPDWCAQCVALKSEFIDAAARLAKKDVRFYVLLAQDTPPPTSMHLGPKPVIVARGKGSPAAATAATPEAPKTPAEFLLGTATAIVPNSTLKDLVADDFPWLVVTDGQGIVRFVQSVPENVLEAKSLADQVVDRVLEQWPMAASVASPLN